MNPPSKKGIDVNSALTDDLTIHQNVQQELVVTTVDKLRICLMEHRDYLAASKEWVPMLGLTLSLFATLVAAQFQDKWLDAPVWEAVYLLSGCAAAAYTFILIVRALRGMKNGTIDKLIDRISKRSQQTAATHIAPELYQRYFLEMMAHSAERNRRAARDDPADH